jgi:hypothetical protein
MHLPALMVWRFKHKGTFIFYGGSYSIWGLAAHIQCDVATL